MVLHETTDRARVGLWRLSDRRLHWLIDDAARNVESARWPHGSDEILVGEATNAIPHFSLLDPVTGRERPFVEQLKPLAPVDGGWAAPAGSRATAMRASRWSSSPLPPARAAPGGEHRVALEGHRAAPLRPDRARRTLRWRSVDGLEIQGWLYRARRPGARRRARRPWRSRAARRRRVRSADPVSRRPRLQRAGAELSRQHRLRHAVPGVDQGAGLGRPRAGGHPHGRAGPDRRRPGGARPRRHHRPVLRRLQFLVRHHALSARGLRRRCAGLRHDRSRHRLRSDAPGPAPDVPRVYGRLARPSSPRSIASARRSISSTTSGAGC